MIMTICYNDDFIDNEVVMISYLQDTTPPLNDCSSISTARGVYKKLKNNKKFGKCELI